MADNALKLRTQADTRLSECVRQTKRYRDSPNPSTRLLKQKMDKLTGLIEDLHNAHIVYGEKSGNDIDSDELKDWITPRIDDANDLADELFVLIDTQELNDANTIAETERNNNRIILTEKNENEIEILETQCQKGRKTIEDKVAEMNAIIDDESRNSTDDKNLVLSHIKEIENFLEEQSKSWNELKRLHVKDAGRLNTVFDEESELKIYVSNHRLNASSYIGVAEAPVKLKEVNSNTSNKSRMLDIQKLPPPTFSGDIRNFAKFKGDFKSIIEPRYPDDTSRAYVIKNSCLKGEALELTKNLNNIDKIWERLHEKYGDDHDIVDSVVKDIEEISSSQSNQGFVKLVNTLEKGIQDLDIIGQADDIASAYTVKLLEKKLSNRVLAKWLDRESTERSDTVDGTKKDGKARFEQMFKFLKDERRQTERLLALKPSTPADPRNPSRGGAGARTAGANANGGGGSGAGGGAEGNAGGGERRFNNNCLVHPNEGHLTRRCRAFLRMSVVQRGNVVRDTNGCKLCLSLSHPNQPCPFETQWGPCPVDGCNEIHSKFIHGCGIAGISASARPTNIIVQSPEPSTTEITAAIESTTSEQSSELNSTERGLPVDLNRNVLLLIQKIRTKKGPVISFWDSGSTISLISKAFALRKKLQGIPVSYDLTTVGGVVTTQDSVMYHIIIIDRKGKKHKITVYEIEDICGDVGAINVNGVVHLFPSLHASEVTRTSGKIELLIGMDRANLHPKSTCEKDGLVLYSSRFGSGKILGGTHSAVSSSDKLNATVQRTARAQVFNIRVRKIHSGVDFFTAEQFGVNCPPRCKRCKGCKECRFETHELSLEERQGLDAIRSNAHLDPINNRWTTTYPFNSDPHILEDNKEQAIQLMKKQEKRLLKDPIAASKYCEQYQGFIDRDVLNVITQEEMNNYKGPVCYVSAHEVFKEGSSSTPVRLVINPSLKYKGRCLNDILMKGPNALNDLFGIQLRFRVHYYALIADISKMYHSIHTTEVEKHLRRLVFRHLKTDEEPKVYGPTRVMFGDRPAAAISAHCIRETADIYKHIDEEASEKIKNDMYVDDLTTGTDDYERLQTLKTNITEILEKGGFQIKGFVTSYDDSPETLALLGTGEIGRVLGIRFDPSKDEFAFVVTINLSKKYKGARTQPDLTVEEIPRLIEMTLTCRIVLSIVNSCYDPLGLLACILIQLKIALRDLFGFEPKLDWDDPIPDHMKQKWIKLIGLLKSVELIRFKRCIKPENAIGDPELLMFSDGSSDAMCTVAYARWLLSDSKFECRLWCAKTRVTPLKKTKIPRVEMQAAVMSSRLSKTIQEQGSLQFTNTYYIIDSTCTLALLKKNTVALKEFMGNKVTEFLQVAKPTQVYHVKSEDNVADLGTRTDAVLSDIDVGSRWQCAPDWTKLNFEDWPVTQDTSNAEVPPEELVAVKVVVAAVTGSSFFIDTERYKNRHNGYELYIRVMAICIKISKTRH